MNMWIILNNMDMLSLVFPDHEYKIPLFFVSLIPFINILKLLVHRDFISLVKFVSILFFDSIINNTILLIIFG